MRFTFPEFLIFIELDNNPNLEKVRVKIETSIVACLNNLLFQLVDNHNHRSNLRYNQICTVIPEHRQGRKL